ncbi:heme peroxidase [Obelidium mucronatum]|nr:heme peroxidase [Obelidium mucronatum]
MKAKLRRLGLNNEDIVALVVGSHSLGGSLSRLMPRPGIFDNDVFKQTLKGNCLLNIDCGIAQDPELRPLVELYAADEQAFFKQYENLFAEEGPGAATPGQGSSSPSAVVILPAKLPTESTSSNAGSFRHNYLPATKSGSSGLILFQTLIFILTASFLIL